MTTATVLSVLLLAHVDERIVRQDHVINFVSVPLGETDIHVVLDAVVITNNKNPAGQDCP